MFYDVSLLNITNKVKLPPIKKLYTIYSLCKNFNQLPHNSFLYFIVYSYFSLIYTNKSIRLLFLSLFFFLKTFDTLQVSKIFKKNEKKFKLFSYNDPNISTNNLNCFWKKWGNLKRPTNTHPTNFIHFDNFKKKVITYVNLGLIKTYNTYILVGVKFETLQSNAVLFSKALINAPKYSSSSINKFLLLSQLNNLEFQYLRKNKVYNKGRYSRTRQNYRTGVYLCMYLSVICIFGLYYWFYKFSFNFTYLWWIFISFVASFFIPKIIKYRLYEPNVLFGKFFDFFRWVLLLLKSFFS